MPSEKQGWDTRAWLVGTLGGIVGGSVTAWAYYPPLAARINTVAHSSSASKTICGIAALVSLLILPGFISGTAHRKPFLWGILPLTLFLAAVMVEDKVENGVIFLGTDSWPGLLVIGFCLLVSSGPVSLFRYRRARAQRKRKFALASLVAEREAASIPQEGIWPPPPDNRPQD